MGLIEMIIGLVVALAGSLGWGMLERKGRKKEQARADDAENTVEVRRRVEALRNENRQELEQEHAAIEDETRDELIDRLTDR